MWRREKRDGARGGHTVRCWSLVGRKERKGGKRENEKGE